MENFIVNEMEEQSIKKKYLSNPQCAEARLVITKHIKVIYVKKDLETDQEEFAIMYELGHYFCEYVPGFFFLIKQNAPDVNLLRLSLLSSCYLLA